MTFVSLHPERMMALINNLNSRATCIEEERRLIHLSSMNNSHGSTPPVQSIEDLSDTVKTANGSTTLYGSAESLKDVSDELAKRRKEVVDLNSDGITIRNTDGTPSYYLPTPSEGVDPASVDTIENVRAYNSEAAANGKAEAAELKEALESPDGISSKGRTVDEILEEMRKHQDIPTYDTSFVKTTGGAQAYVRLMEQIDRHYGRDTTSIENAVEVFGHVLGGASQAEVGGEALGQEMGATVIASPTEDAASIVNALIDQPDVSYGTAFLVNAGDALEDVDPERLGSGMTYISTQYSNDPLAGTLNAMGRNPEAALEYLGGDGTVDTEGNWVPDDTSKERWGKLKNRNWDLGAPPAAAHKGIEGFTAALAAVSAYRNPDPSEPEKRPGADAAATYAAGMGIDYFSGPSWSKNDFSETMKQNMSVVLANSPEEVAATASGDILEQPDKGPGLEKWGVDKTDISTIIYRFGDSDLAMSTLSAGLGDYHHKQYETAMAGTTNPRGELQNQQEQRSATLHYIQTLSQQRLKDNIVESNDEADDAAARNTQTANTIVSVFNTAATAGITAVSGGAGAPLAYGLASTITQPLAADALASMMPVPSVESNDPSDSNDASKDYYSRLRAQSYADAIELELSQEGDQGIIDSEALEDLKSQNWYNPNPEPGQPHVDTSKMTTDQIGSMIGWSIDHGGSNEILVNLNTSTSNGKSHAEAAAGQPEAEEESEAEEEEEKSKEEEVWRS